MNAIQILSAQPWVERLGWTLLHFLWEGILIAAVYGALRTWMGPAMGPERRYLLGCAAMAAMAGAALITWSVLGHGSTSMAPGAAGAHLHFAGAGARAFAPARGTTTGLLRLTAAQAVPPMLLPWVVAVWLAGAMVFWARLMGGWICAVRLRSERAVTAPREWQQALERLKTRIGVSRPVRLLVSGLVEAPAVVGWLKPVVLVPVGALAGLPADQVEALLFHELAHIRRHDYLVNVAQNMVEALLFYHPAVWWISGHIRAERELCCDDAAVRLSGDAVTYARALAELESARPAHLGTAMAANGGSLRERIGRLLGEPKPASRSFSGTGMLLAAVLPAITVYAVFAQPAPRPKFEVASVKPSQEQRFMMVRPMPGRLTANAPVQLLMQNAYTVQPFQIVGGPAWIRSERWEIEAKADGNASRADLFLMLQSLLEDRFQLKTHRETREEPVYALVAAKSGLKLPPPKEGNCVDAPADAPADWAGGGRMQPPGRGPAPPARCGSVNVALEMAGAQLQGGKIAMAEFIRILSMVLGRPVMDKTGFTHLFDVRLKFLPDETTEALPAPPRDAASGMTDAGAVSILIALQEQLGLRLETAKGPVEVMVIDRVERPGAN